MTEIKIVKLSELPHEMGSLECRKRFCSHSAYLIVVALQP